MTKTELSLFFGTGGVGKTTLSSAWAAYQAGLSKRVLLITIDPSLRLKQVFGLEKSYQRVHLLENISFDVKLFNPQESLKTLLLDRAHKSREKTLLDDPIIKNLIGPEGSLHETMALVELEMALESGQYDLIVMDTPPGPHFLDFLDSLGRIEKFFSPRLIQLFSLISDTFQIDKDKSTKGVSLFKALDPRKLVAAPLKKLLSLLNQVTGEKFLEEFVTTISRLYEHKEVFTNALSLRKKFHESSFAQLFLVTSFEQMKVGEADQMLKKVKEHFDSTFTICLNMDQEYRLNQWQEHINKSSKESSFHPIFQFILNERLKVLDKFKDEKKVWHFQEILDSDPLQHVLALVNTMREYDTQSDEY